VRSRQDEPIPGKSAWPELLGKQATLAALAMVVEVLPPGSPVAPEYNPERVRVQIDDNGLVSQVPVIG